MAIVSPKTIVMDCEFEPPIEIMQHIQSFLNGKEAAQTCILSKTWFTAWLYRPGLYFDEGDFHKKLHGIEFPNFTRKTVQRYKDLNLRVDKFVLKLNRKYSKFSGVDELIADALELGANELELEMELNFHHIGYNLPAHVFAARSLTRLYIYHGRISLPVDGRVLSSCLKSLSLHHVIVTDDIVRNILRGCPLIENLDLNQCRGLANVDLSKRLNLVELRVENLQMETRVENLQIQTHVEFKDVGTGLAVHKPEFRYLRRLNLINVKTVREFFTEFSSRFPCIEDFTLAGLKDCYKVDISSHSLKYLTLYGLGDELRILRLNVPNISKFIYKESNPFLLRLLAFKFITVSKEWESDVELETGYSEVIYTSWLVDLRKFLAELSESKISLTIKSDGPIFYSSDKVPCLDIPIVVENLTLCADPRAVRKRTFLIGLLGSFHPNFVTDCKPNRHSHHECLHQLLIEDENKGLLHMYKRRKLM